MQFQVIVVSAVRCFKRSFHQCSWSTALLSFTSLDSLHSPQFLSLLVASKFQSRRHILHIVHLRKKKNETVSEMEWGWGCKNLTVKQK